MSTIFRKRPPEATGTETGSLPCTKPSRSCGPTPADLTFPSEGTAGCRCYQVVPRYRHGVGRCFSYKMSGVVRRIVRHWAKARRAVFGRRYSSETPLQANYYGDRRKGSPSARIWICSDGGVDRVLLVIYVMGGYERF